jgi:hypothetical protein
MRKYITQLLEDINDDPKKLEQYAKDQVYSNTLKVLFDNAFDPTKKWILPEGEPPFKPAAEPLGMTPSNLYGELRRLYVFTRADLHPVKRESLFISLLEGVHPSEADVLIAIKDQTLHKKYPKITRKLVESFGFVPALPKKDKESAAS